MKEINAAQISSKMIYNSIMLMPNSAHYVFSLLFAEGNKNAVLLVYNSIGQLIEKRNTVNETRIQFNVKTCEGGMYYCKVKMNDGKIVTKMITVIK